MWRRPQTHMWFNRTDKPLTAAYDCTTMITLGFRQNMLMETTTLAQTGAWLMLFTSTGAKSTPMKRLWVLDPLHTPVLIYIILLYQGCSKYHQMFSHRRHTHPSALLWLRHPWLSCWMTPSITKHCSSSSHRGPTDCLPKHRSQSSSPNSTHSSSLASETHSDRRQTDRPRLTVILPW